MNGILKDRWYNLTADEKHYWKEWEAWDAKRFEHQMEIFENPSQKKKNQRDSGSDGDVKRMKNDLTSPMKGAAHIPKKGRTESSSGAFSIPKKRKL